MTNLKTVELTVNWNDQYGIPRTVRRAATWHPNVQNWIDGWLAGVTEMVNWRGGHVTATVVDGIETEVVSE